MLPRLRTQCGDHILTQPSSKNLHRAYVGKPTCFSCRYVFPDFYNYHMSKSASQQHPLFSSSPESQMPQMLLTDVSIWKESGARELRKGRAETWSDKKQHHGPTTHCLQSLSCISVGFWYKPQKVLNHVLLFSNEKKLDPIFIGHIKSPGSRSLDFSYFRS